MFYYWDFDEDCIVPFFIFIFIFIVIIIGIALTDDTKYGYIDLDGNEGIAEHCRENYCEVDNKTITVKEFWKIEIEKED